MIGVLLLALSYVKCVADEGLPVAIDVMWETKQKEGGYGVKFSGTTNLPAESRFRVTLRTFASNTGPGGSAECNVLLDGTFSTGDYGPFPAGEYEVEVQFEPRSQSPEVKAVTGEKGEALKGDLVATLKVGNFAWNVARKIVRIQMGNELEAARAASEKAAKTKDIATRILTLRELMAEIYSRKDDLQWIPFAREFTKQWGEIRDELKPHGVVEMQSEIAASHAALYEMFKACRGSDPAKAEAADAEFRTTAAPLVALIQSGGGREEDARPRVAQPASGVEHLQEEIKKLEAAKTEAAKQDNRTAVKRLAAELREAKGKLSRLMREQKEHPEDAK
jgi:hypothetical protein